MFKDCIMKAWSVCTGSLLQIFMPYVFELWDVLATCQRNDTILRGKCLNQNSNLESWVWQSNMLTTKLWHPFTFWGNLINIHELISVCPWTRNVWVFSETTYSSQTKLVGLNLLIGQHGIGYSNLTRGSKFKFHQIKKLR